MKKRLRARPEHPSVSAVLRSERQRPRETTDTVGWLIPEWYTCVLRNHGVPTDGWYRADDEDYTVSAGVKHPEHPTVSAVIWYEIKQVSRTTDIVGWRGGKKLRLSQPGRTLLLKRDGRRWDGNKLGTLGEETYGRKPARRPERHRRYSHERIRSTVEPQRTYCQVDLGDSKKTRRWDSNEKTCRRTSDKPESCRAVTMMGRRSGGDTPTPLRPLFQHERPPGWRNYSQFEAVVTSHF